MTITKISHRIALSRSYNYQNAVIEWAAEATVAEGENVEEAKKALKNALRADVKDDSAAAIKFVVNEAKKFEQETVALMRAKHEATQAAARTGTA